jgi:predicted nucleic acid-binding Zn ribbon protein
MTSNARVDQPAPAGPAEPTHGCVRCGAPIPISDGMCERCNPLGLKDPAASQAHGTVFLGIGLAVVIMAVAAHLALSGIGPFSGAVAGVASTATGLRVTISITNAGSKAGSTTCRIDDPDLPGIGPDAVFVQSPVVDPGATISFDTKVSSFGTEIRALHVDCSG